MTRRTWIFSITSIIILSLFVPQERVQAVPLLPSSFYGMVQVNNMPVPDGTPVQAVIADQVVASGATLTHQGNSYYALDIPSDDTATTIIDGGKEGDTIHFTVGGLQAAQTGTWHSGTNVEVNLKVTSAATPLPPQPTTAPNPTQTPIQIIAPSATLVPTQFFGSATVLNPTSVPTTTSRVAKITATEIIQVSKTTALTAKDTTSVSPTPSLLPIEESGTNNPSRRKAQYLSLGIIFLAVITILVMLVRRGIQHKKI